MTGQLAETCCARLPAAALAHLAALRARADLSGFVAADSLWLFWPSGNIDLSRAILAIDGAELFLRRGREWYRPGEHLPVFRIPKAEDARPLSALLFPSPVSPVRPGQIAFQPAPLSLARCGVPRTATALLAERSELQRWAESATSFQLDMVLAACCGDVVLMRGKRHRSPGDSTGIPVLPGERFWGWQVLLPLGWRVEPDLAEEVLTAALGLQDDAVALWTASGVEILSGTAFGPVTRAGVRGAGKGAYA